MNSINALLERGFASLREGNFPACAGHAAAVLRQDPQQPQAHLLAGLVAFHNRDYVGAVQFLSRAQELGDENFSSLLCTIDALRQLKALTRDNLLAVARHWARITTPAEFQGQLQQLLCTLKPTPERIDLAEIAATLDAIAVPALRELLASEEFDAALHLEMQLYNQFVKVIETEAHFAACTARWVPHLQAAGQALALPQPLVRVPAGQTPKVAFVIHTAATEAHVEVVANILQGYRQLAEQPFEPVVYCLFNHKPEMTALFQPAGVAVQYMDTLGLRPGSVVERLRYLRDAARQQGIDTVVWVSNPIWMSFAFAMRIARKQVWLALKYHDLATPDIDAYLTGGGMSRYKAFGGRQWRVGLAGYDNLYDPGLSAAAQQLRKQFCAGQPRVIAGSLGRPEKLRDPLFLATICRLLQDHPEMLFLWTGREQDTAIQQTFDQAEVAAQTRYIGWVNTRLYAQVMDVFLDSFPFPCGFTLYEALMAKVPCVCMATPESATLGLHGYITPVLAGADGEPGDAADIRSLFALDSAEPLFLLAHSTHQYYEFASRLVSDAGFRDRVGDAGQQFARRYLAGSARPAGSYSRHLAEIIAEA